MKLEEIYESMINNMNVALQFPRTSDLVRMKWRKLEDFRGEHDFNVKIKEFTASDMNLTSLEGGPQDVEVYLASNNDLTSLKGLAPNVNWLECSHNKLTNLDFTPRELKKLICEDNLITSLEGSPLKCRSFICNENSITSLVGIGKRYLISSRYIDISGNPIKSNILGLLTVRELNSLVCDDHLKPFEILQRHIHDPEQDIMECREELVQTGFKEYAKL